MVGRPRKKEKVLNENSTIKKYFDVYSLLQEKPYTIKEISEKTQIKENTLYNIKDVLLALNKIKKVENKFASVNYHPLEEKIEAQLKSLYKERFPTSHLPESFANKVATLLGEKDDELFREAFKQVCKKNNIQVLTNT